MNVSGGLPATAFEPEVATPEVAVEPLLGAVGFVDDAWHPVPVLGRDVGVEHVGRFADVVVDGDEDEIVGVHTHVVTSPNSPTVREQLHDELALATHHALVSVARLVGVAVGDGSGDIGQALPFDLDRAGHEGEEVTREEPGHRPQHDLDARRGGGVDDRGVEGDRQPLDLLRIVGARDPTHDLFDALAQVGPRPADRAAHRESVYEPEQLVGIARRLLVEGVDEHASVHLDRDPALPLQHDERLAYRDAADAQRLRDLLLGDPLTRSEPALEDQPADVHGGVLPAAPAHQLPAGGERLACGLVALAHRRHDCIRYATRPSAR